jgi:hypothetical protein
VLVLGTKSGSVQKVARWDGGGVKLVHDCNRRAAPVSEKEGDIKGGVGGQASVGNGLGGAGDGIIGI